MPELSVITVAYNSVAVLPGFLESVRAATSGADIVVVDNGSADATAKLIRERTDVRLIEAGSNLGFGRGCNLGAKAAAGEWLLFANPDVRTSVITLPTMLSTERFGVGAGQVSDSGGEALSGVRAEPTRVEDWHREVFGRFLPRGINQIVPTRHRPAGWAYGALMLVRADEFAHVGGFDERFFLYHEDRDLGARYRSRGMPVRDLPQLVGRHLKGQSVAGAHNLAAEAWAFVSWIEYLCIWRGPAVAVANAANALRVWRMMGRLYSSRLGDRRARGKAEAASTLADHVLAFARHLPPGSTSCYPNAQAALVQAETRMRRS
jgi:N-acetylglucosaminyl-diphospho-decaprenol L-rhamnosyltransferase